MQNFTYSISSIIAVLIHLIVNFRLIIGRGDGLEYGRRYRGFLIGILSYYVTDAAWGILAGLGWTGLLYIDTILFFLALVAFVFMWAHFVIYYLGFDKWTARVLYGFGSALLAYNIVMLTANTFNNCLFDFDDQGNYLIGNQRFLALAFLVAFHLLIAVCVFRKALGSQETDRRRGMMAFVFCVTMVISILLQIILPLTPITSLGCLTGNCFFHFFVIADEHTKKRMDELEKSLERAHAAEKAKSFFFSSVSHDIRTPLNSIIGFSEILKLGIKDPDENEKALDAISTSANMLLELINDVLDLAKLESGKMEIKPVPTDIGSVIKKVATAFEVAASRSSVQLRTEIEKMPFLELDPQRIRQILFNLIGNAVKFTSKGTITVRASYKDGAFTVSVTDTGCGIEPENIKKLMSPFVQLREHANIKGTGLGLAICKQLATRMNGTLDIASTFGKGSTFTLRIPNVKAFSEKEAEDYVREEASHAEIQLDDSILKMHLLVVDDQKLNLKILQTMLSRLGIADILTAENGKVALDTLYRSENVDLVLTDMSMPVMDGTELVREIRKEPRFNRIPVYVITADVEMQGQAESVGFDGFLIKPINLEKLKGLLASYVPRHPADIPGDGGDKKA